MSDSKPFKHVIGNETEHGGHDPSLKDPGDIICDRIMKAIAGLAPRYGQWVCGNLWTKTGARAYKDANRKLEYATGEGDNGEEVALHELAGSVLYAIAACDADSALKRTSGRTYIMRTNTVTDGASGGGNHTSVSMPVGNYPEDYSRLDRYRKDFDLVVDFLRPFVSSLQLLTGTGVVVPRSSAWTRVRGDSYSYAISPRAYHVTRDWGSASNAQAEGDKPLFLYRDEPHVGDRLDIWRLQICGLDSGLLYDMLRLKYDLILLMAEMFVAGKLEKLVVRDPHWGHMALAISLDWRTEFNTWLGRSRRKMTALDIQRFYLHQAENYVLKERDGRGQVLLSEWAGLLNEFDTNEDVPTGLYGRVDWVTKFMLLKGAERRLKEKDPEAVLSYDKAQEIHLDYHAFWLDRSGSNPPKVCKPLSLIGRFGPPGITSRLCQALEEPPSGTRAVARATLVGACQAKSIGWDYFNPLDGDQFRMLEPTATTTPELEKFLDNLEEAA